MGNWKKRFVASFLAVFVLSGTAVPVAMANPWNALAQGAVAMVYVKKELRRMDDEGQAESLQRTKEQTGYYDNATYQQRAQNILDRFEALPTIKRKYAIYVNPNEKFNAFMTIGAVMSINKGAMDVLDDDKLAYVVAHELSHGEDRHVLSGVEKQIGIATAISIATDGGGAGASMLGNVVGNYINNEMFTMSQEKSADKKGFEYLTEAGFNPGGAAASMAILRDAYGDTYSEGLSQVVQPNNHPKTSTRVTENVKRMKEYSGNHVDVKDNTVIVNGISVYAPPAMGNDTGEIRSYYMAGKIARLYKENRIKGSAVRIEGSTVYIDSTAIVTTDSYTTAAETAKKLETGLNK